MPIHRPDPVTIASHRRIGRRSFDFNHRVAVMAVVNRTRDSFFDQGRTYALQAAVEACLGAAEAGADLVDVGGVPFSPDTEPVSEAEEVGRVVPLLEEVARHSDVALSVDTARAGVAQQAVAAGAGLVNDTSSDLAPEMAGVVRAAGVQVVLTHSLTGPQRRASGPPRYTDVVAEVVASLTDRVAAALALGVGEQQLLVDPGPDLNKNTQDTLRLLAGFDRFAALGLPTLVAVSNKDFVGETLDRERADRLPGTLAATVACVLAGGRVVRAHDVAATVDAVRMAEALMGVREPVRAEHNTR